MKLIIDAPDEIVEKGFEGPLTDEERQILIRAIGNGIPLPKGHGELIDKNVVLDMMNHGILEDYITAMSGVIPADTRGAE